MLTTNEPPRRPIIIVTGANNGIGFGICRRLLYGLVQNSPDDALPVFPRSLAHHDGSAEHERERGPELEYPCAGATLIMACRSRQRAEAARAQLLELFERDLARLKAAAPGTADRVAAFRANLVIAIHALDLASVQSTLAFADEVARAYPYVSHLVCNAGVAPFQNISVPLLCKQIWKNLLEFNLIDIVAHPTYVTQSVGLTSEDGLGWVWQCNVFGHYILCRALEAKLAASRTGPGRVVWMSSFEAHADVYDAEDWQLVDNPKPYQASKFEMDLIRAELSRRAGPSALVRHFTVQPGVVNSSIDVQIVAHGILLYLKEALIYVARLCGSLHHNITPWNGAAAAVYVCLAPLALIPVFLSATGASPTQEDKDKDGLLPLRLNSITDRMGRNSVAITPFYEWAKYEKDASRLVDRCERLYQSFTTAGGKRPGNDVMK